MNRAQETAAQRELLGGEVAGLLWRENGERLSYGAVGESGVAQGRNRRVSVEFVEVLDRAGGGFGVEVDVYVRYTR